MPTCVDTAVKGFFEQQLLKNCFSRCLKSIPRQAVLTNRTGLYDYRPILPQAICVQAGIIRGHPGDGKAFERELPTGSTKLLSLRGIL